jgi:hypothetical protein
MPIDYARMSKAHPKQKAALTRAMNAWKQARLNLTLHASFDTRPVDRAAEHVEHVVKAAIVEWNEIGAWPDDWSRWQVALNDTRHFRDFIDLRDL